jgi:hypothetical protein
VINQEGLGAMRTTLVADDYALEVTESGDRVEVRISVADSEACGLRGARADHPRDPAQIARRAGTGPST